MNQIYANALKNGKLIKSQGFNTPKGIYSLNYVRYEGEIYMFKYLYNKIVECCNLSKEKGEGV